MEIMETLAILCAILGLVGSIVPALPGPPVSWIGLLLVFLNGSAGRGEPMTLSALFIWLAIVTVAVVLDYLLPARFTALTGGHKEASIGAVIGLFAGMFFTPIGMITGSLIGAFLGEMIVNADGPLPALKAAAGAFIGFIVTTGMKIVLCGVMAYYIFDYIF